MNPPQLIFTAFSIWDALTLFSVGVMIGYLVFSQVWPLRTQSNLPYPIPLAAVVANGTFLVFFLLLLMLRWVGGQPFPLATAVEGLIFSMGGTIGLAIRNWRRRHG